MPFLDDERVRYPIEYINMLEGTITNLKEVAGKPDLKTFVFTSHLGFSIECQTRVDLTPNIKEGKITAGTAEGVFKFINSEDRDLSKTKIFMTVEEWKDVVIE